MNSIPSGIVTFLFTDIEGSTKLAQDFPETLQISLDKHHSILRSALESNKGFVFEIIGDAFCAAFEKADDAVKAAADIQLKLSNEKFDDVVIKVRIGIHSGNAEWNGKRYMGYITLARTARIMSAAYGEQILISTDAYEYIKEKIKQTNSNIHTEGNEEISFRDLGERRLKDVIQPIRLYQVLSRDLCEDFPPLKTLDARPNNLPMQLTSFVGREAEMKHLKDLLKQNRLLTLTGSGGSGKSRLSLQVAADAIDNFANGVWFIELASLSDPDLLEQQISKVFGLKEASGKSPEAALLEYLSDKEILIILDNCEHLVDACAVLTEKLLNNCPRLKIIATSRQALRCDGEQTHRVLSLEIPDPNEKNSPEKLSQYESVRLFIERAFLVNSAFRVTNENAPAVAQICFQLDGIPLAIELAAARIKILPVEKINERLNDRFSLLTGGKRTALPRQQTLRALIDWSYGLLTEEEKQLWRKLSVFSGGWTLEAAEVICSGDKINISDILDLLNQLAEKSIVIYDELNDRYKILETIKQYGKEKLKDADETDIASSRHLNYYIGFSESAEPKLNGNEIQFWIERLEAEHSNLQSAINWSMSAGKIETSARFAGALGNFWFIRGHYSTGLRLIESILENVHDVSKPVLGKVLNWAGILSTSLGEFEKARKYFEESLKISREIGNSDGIARSLNGLGNLAFYQGNYNQAQKLHEESLTLSLELSDDLGIAQSYTNLGNIAFYHSDWKKAKKFYEDSLALNREIGAKRGIDRALHNLGIVAIITENFEQAKEFFEEGLALYKEVGDKSGIALTLNNLGNLSFYSGNFEESKKYYEESYELFREIGDRKGISQPLTNLGSTSLALKNVEDAKKFCEESLALCKEVGDKRGIAETINNMGSVEFYLGNYPEAQKFLQESLDLRTETGDKRGIAYSLNSLGSLAYYQKNYEKARKNYQESLELFIKLGDKSGIAYNLIGYAGVLGARNNPSHAVTLLGAVDAALISITRALQVDILELKEIITHDLHNQLSDEEFLKYSEEGKKLSLDEASDLVLNFES